MRAKAAQAAACILALTLVAGVEYALAQGSSVELNSDVVGRTAPGQYRGIPAMQDNEPSCAINPLLARNIICAWNASGGSDDPAGPGYILASPLDREVSQN